MPQYFTGKKASGYIVITDPTLPGGKVELETRMCAHCGFHGLYSPGNARQYLKYTGTKNFINGVCIPCGGLVCMRPECNQKCMILEQRLDLYEKGKVASIN